MSPLDKPHPRATSLYNAVTYRSLIAGLVATLAVALGCPYATFVVRGSYMDLDFSTPGAVFLLFLLAGGINRLLRVIRPKWSLNPGELLFAYIMALMASAVSTMGFAAQMLPIISAPYYFASPENRWAEVLLPHIRPWTTPHGRDVIRYFYEGMPKAGSVPWSAWMPVLLSWAPLILALYAVMIATMVLLRKQWVENERLVYPLTHLPLEMAMDADPTSRRGGFFCNGGMWIGFAIPFAVSALTALHYYFPAVPSLTLAKGFPIFQNRDRIAFRLSFPMLGFFYLVNLETSFSLWWFNLLALLVRGCMKRVGWGITEPFGIYGTPFATFKFVGIGAFLVLVGYGLWTGRRHFALVFKKVVYDDPSVDDSREILSYRSAFAITLLGLAVMYLWLMQSGLRWHVCAVFLVATMAIFVGLTRVVVESGLAEAVAPTIGSSFTVAALGSRTIGPNGLTALGMTYVWSSDIRTVVMTSAANSLKLADLMTPRRGLMFPAMYAATLLAAVSSTVYILWLAYKDGGIVMNNWFFVGGPRACWDYVAALLTGKPTGPHPGAITATVAGAGIMTFLMLMRQYFLWWPFHPVGFAIGSVWIMDELWLTCFLAWLLKWVVVRYGGLGLFRRSRPFFLGLIAGQFCASSFWILADTLTKKQGNQVFWI